MSETTTTEGKGAVGTEAELGLTGEERLAMRDAEDATRAYLAEQPTARVYVPASVTGGEPLVAIINGVRFSVPTDQEIEVPEPIAELVRVRVRQSQEADAVARAGRSLW